MVKSGVGERGGAGLATGMTSESASESSIRMAAEPDEEAGMWEEDAAASSCGAEIGESSTSLRVDRVLIPLRVCIDDGVSSFDRFDGGGVANELGDSVSLLVRVETELGGRTEGTGRRLGRLEMLWRARLGYPCVVLLLLSRLFAAAPPLRQLASVSCAALAPCLPPGATSFRSIV